jgi:G3E family GTPase
MSGAIPITVLTGFLGSGKTTVLNHLVHQPALARSLVIINEFGEVGLDHMLVTHSAEEGVVQMSSGCLCCTIRKDLVQTLKDITWRFSIRGERLFDRVLIETTGLADPAPILHTLIGNEIVTAHYQLDGVVTTVDAVNGLASIESQTEAKRQVAVADKILLTKSDLGDSESHELLVARISQLNPGAKVTPVSNGVIDPAGLLGLGPFDASAKASDVTQWLGAVESEEHHHHGHDVNRHSDSIRADSFEFVLAVCPTTEQLTQWVSELAEQFGPQLLRFKAVVPVSDQTDPLVVHAVQHVVHTIAPLTTADSFDSVMRLVIITDGVPAEKVQQRVDQLVALAS